MPSRIPISAYGYLRLCRCSKLGNRYRAIPNNLVVTQTETSPMEVLSKLYAVSVVEDLPAWAIKLQLLADPESGHSRGCKSPNTIGAEDQLWMSKHYVSVFSLMADRYCRHLEDRKSRTRILSWDCHAEPRYIGLLYFTKLPPSKTHPSFHIHHKLSSSSLTSRNVVFQAFRSD